MTRLIAIPIFALGVGLVGCSKSDARTTARKEVEATLKDSLGNVGDPTVSFLLELKTGPQQFGHLQVQFDTIAFANMSDSAFAERSRQIAGLANRHYNGGTLDSVSVLSRTQMGPGAWRVVRMQTYAVRDLSGRTSSP
jgi:hypothetical protein